MNAGSRTRVLIVEDDPSALHLHSARLSRAGFEVTESSKPTDALRHAANSHFDVVVTDFRLPEMDGLELVRRLRRDTTSLESVLILDTTNNQLSLEAAKIGVFQSLVKPIEPRTLTETVELAVRFRREQPNVVKVRTRGSSASKPVSFRASKAKNEFGRLLEKAIQGHIVLITKHDTPKAVLISVEEFEALSHAPETRIDSLSVEFDSLLAKMQVPAARKAMDTAFRASPAALGKAAVAAARKRG